MLSTVNIGLLLFQVKHTASYTTTSPSNNVSTRGTTNQSFTEPSSFNSSMASLNIENNEPVNSLNTGMASLNIKGRSHDTTDGPVELPDDIDVVFVDGDDKKLCLATVSVAEEKITGCGHGNSKESAKQNAIENLKSNFKILCTPMKI